MDIDTICINQLTTEEKDKCVKEGRCFWCQKQGHRLKECPLKKTANATAQFTAQMQQVQIRTNEVVNNCDTEADEAKSVASDATTFSWTDTIQNLWALKEEERLELIDELFKENSDFW